MKMSTATDSKCPKCSASNIAACEAERAGEGALSQVSSCGGCGAVWRALYHLVAIEEFEERLEKFGEAAGPSDSGRAELSGLRAATAAGAHAAEEREVLDRSSERAHAALEATMRRADEAQARVDDYDSRMTAARNALTRAGVPDVEEAPNHPLLGDVRRSLDVAERIDMLVQTFKDARAILAGALEDAVERAVKAEKERDELDSTASFVLRPEVAAFAMLMEERLLLNDHKAGWKNDDLLALVARLHDETSKLVRRAWGSRPKIGGDAADVANFAMMIADVSGALDAGVLRARARIEAHHPNDKGVTRAADECQQQACLEVRESDVHARVRALRVGADEGYVLTEHLILTMARERDALRVRLAAADWLLNAARNKTYEPDDLAKAITAHLEDHDKLRE